MFRGYLVTDLYTSFTNKITIFLKTMLNEELKIANFILFKI